ncbi:nucleotidyltransferase domain-containing protein [Pseudothermotoga elfii]
MPKRSSQIRGALQLIRKGNFTAFSDVDLLVVYDDPIREDAYKIVKKTIRLKGLELHVYSLSEYKHVGIYRMNLINSCVFIEHRKEGAVFYVMEMNLRIQRVCGEWFRGGGTPREFYEPSRVEAGSHRFSRFRVGFIMIHQKDSVHLRNWLSQKYYDVLLDMLWDISYDFSGGDDMRFVSSRDIRNNPAVLWKDDETVITVNGKPKAIVMKIDGDPKEILDFIEKIRVQMAVEKLRLFSLEKGLDRLSEDEIEEIVREARKQK